LISKQPRNVIAPLAARAFMTGAWNFCIMAPHPTISYDHAMTGRVCSIRRLRGLQAVKLRLKPSSRDKGPAVPRA
jgi:hypothetical protein